jgi:hypothetical protein
MTMTQSSYPAHPSHRHPDILYVDSFFAEGQTMGKGCYGMCEPCMCGLPAAIIRPSYWPECLALPISSHLNGVTGGGPINSGHFCLVEIERKG